MSAPAALDTATLEKFRKITAMTYKEQAVFYLNAFWKDGAEAEAESVWKTMHDFIAVDHAKGKNGNQLDEVLSHHYLQKVGRTLTAIELRQELRKIDLDANGEMALAEYLIFRAGQTGTPREVIALINNPQGGEANPEELVAAQNQLDALTKAFEELQVQLDQQKELEAASRKASADAVKVEAAAVAAERVAKDAEAQVRAAEQLVRDAEAEAVAVDAALKAEQDAYTGEMARLEAITKDDSAGIVKRNTAVQDLARMKGADPLPLQRAKINQEAQVRKVQRARKAAEEKTAEAAEKTAEAVAQREHAVQARHAAEAAAAAAEEQTKAVEAQLAAVQAQTAEAEKKLEELKSQAGVPHGAIWWMEREILEKKRSLPQRFQ